MQRHLHDISPLSTSYEMGLKRVLLSANESGCSITQIAVLELKAGERSAQHIHPDLQDAFFILDGEIDITIDGQVHHCQKEDFIFVEHLKAYELHAITDVRMLAMGCVIEAQRTKLYPILFEPNLRPMVWGGKRLTNWKQLPEQDNIGESWEVSTLDMLPSVIANGTWAGYPLSEVIAKMPEAILGKAVAKKYHNQMPLLVKFIDTKADLSVQVHPDDAMAQREHNGSGKTEMWYVVDADKDAYIYAGFKEELTPEEYARRVADGTIMDALAKHEIRTGDVFYIPAGRVHAIGKGVILVEVQQSSDLTYRIYDWDRVDAEGKSRELHTALAVDAIDFEADAEELHKRYTLPAGGEKCVIDTPYFVMSLIDVAEHKVVDRSSLDSFVIYICLSGGVKLAADGVEESLNEGELVLIPAEMNEMEFIGNGRLMEVYIR